MAAPAAQGVPGCKLGSSGASPGSRGRGPGDWQWACDARCSPAQLLWAAQCLTTLDLTQTAWPLHREYVHFQKTQGPWWERVEVRALGALVGVGGVVWFVFREDIPYTHRKHFAPLSPSMEKRMGMQVFQQVRACRPYLFYMDNVIDSHFKSSITSAYCICHNPC